MADLGKQLLNPPADGISALRFAGDTDVLLASSWDGTVRLYDAAAGELMATLTHGAPVLDAEFESDSAVLTAGLDGTVKRFDVQSGQHQVLGSHSGGVRCVQWLEARGLVASAAWDSLLQLWDPRQAPGAAAVAAITLPGKAYSMSHSDTRLVVATSGRHVNIYDLRTLATGSQPEQRRESSLKYQTRCVACFASNEGYALASVEGRVAMEYFDASDAAQARKYAFKCHRRSDGGRDVVYPVNSIAFNKACGTFATGGCDGVVNIWDGEHKKRLHQISAYPTSVAAMAFNASATLLAVAASYTYELGEADHPPDAIYVRQMAAAEVTPRQARVAG